MAWEPFDTYESIKQSDDDADAHRQQLDKEIEEHADYLAAHIPQRSINSFLLDKIGNRCESRCIIDKLFDDDVNFQEWVSEVRDELCMRIAMADIEEKYRE